MSNAGAEFTRLVEIMATLRSPEGCPWDREQTLQSLSQYVLEEAYEVVDAIDRGDLDALREEIGDHIFEGVFLSANRRRHEGVHASPTPCGPSRTSWCGAIRTCSARMAGCTTPSRRSGRPRRTPPCRGGTHKRRGRRRRPARPRARSPGCREASLPCTAPTRSAVAPRPSASIGRRRRDVVGKIEEEVAELRETLVEAPDNIARAEEEMGDLLFAIANLSRKLGIEPEAALRKANDKFTERFGAMETRIAGSGREMTSMALEELETEWQHVKADSPSGCIKTSSETRNHERGTRLGTIRRNPSGSAATLKFNSRPDSQFGHPQIAAHLRMVNRARAAPLP